MSKGADAALVRRIEELLAADPGVSWSVSISRDGQVLAEVNADLVLRTASMGKVFLLAEVARRIELGSLDRQAWLRAEQVGMVADSGLWQFFSGVPLTVEALAVLVAAVSDNLATNVLLAEVGLDSVQQRSDELGMEGTRMLDSIRDARSPEDPIAPSVGTARDFARYMALMHAGRLLSIPISRQLRSWLALGTDLSMVASALRLDPLAHSEDRWQLANKTGTDAGVRADAGAFESEGSTWAYAVIANWPADDVNRLAEVIDGMRRMGRALVDAAVLIDEAG